MHTSAGRRRPLAPLLPLALLSVVALTGACTAQGDETSKPSSVVVQPGRPGEAATTISPEDFDGVDDPYSEWNDADVEFVTVMIDHHAQALEMSALAPGRASSEQVRTFAERIEGAQAGEIHALAAWLEARGLPVPVAAEAADGTGPRTPSDAGHGHAGMPGAVSAEELANLEAASGTEFDRAFLELMIRHHRGAVEMAHTVVAEGTDVYAGEMADETAAGQTAEIDRMEDLLAGM
ncbi:DUF305 domain-containing protein [Antribacter gilvus]|uniref:DUF305 domain-containing protein n=1 Tax=Antribacter gilvus TaxID=2304675 RepID=UPI00197E7058|nr:DUF305 domain-containing protein [Antribacter gilvus]